MTEMSLTSRFRRHLLTGLLVIVPALVAGWVLVQAFLWVDHLLWDRLRFSFLREGGVPGVGFLLVLVFVLATGWVTNHYIGGRLVRAGERMMLKIPLFNKIYGATRQVSEAFLSPEGTNVFRSVGMVEFPRPGSWAMAFEVSPVPEIVRRQLTGDVTHDPVAVFVPSTPNPTTGFLVMVSRADYRQLDIPLEDGLKTVISGGVFMPIDRIVPRDDGTVAVEREERRGA